MDIMLYFRMRLLLFSAVQCLLILPQSESVASSFSYKGRLLEKERAFLEAKYLDDRGRTSCTSLRKPSAKNALNLGVTVTKDTSRSSRNKRATDEKDAIYFEGRQMLRLRLSENRRKILLPESVFTVEVWLKPEGGQQKWTSIIGLYDDCLPSKNLGWSLGISSHDAGSTKDARIYFRMRTDRAREETVLWTPHKYVPGVWLHVAVSYNGKTIKIFINGAKVAVSTGQSGNVFTSVFRRCKDFVIGGHPYDKTSYRGGMGALRLWSIDRNHREVNANMFNFGLHNPSEDLVLQEYFTDRESWIGIGLKSPTHMTMVTNPNTHDITLSAPPCGQTVCDDPVVVRAYERNSGLREMKTIRYHVINVVGNDGNNPTVSKEQLSLQDTAVRSMFKPYNINWQLTEVRVENETLRNKTVIFGCDPLKVGDGFCHSECLHVHTGWDGGDCDREVADCDEGSLGDGNCDPPCNNGLYGWDGGDCCHEEASQCYDPHSPNRIYASIAEYKNAIGLTGESNLNVYFANWTDESLLGVATLPWERTVFSIEGGVVVRPDAFGIPGRTKNLVHELGHVLGLWHVHYGVSEMSCGDPCLETEPSMVLGDMCSDTSPTPENPTCRDPHPDTYTCAVSPHSDTPFNNYMSYSGENCSDHFTPQQVARMHCYADLVYQSWQDVRTPSPIPFSPQPIWASRSQMTLAWLKPLGTAAEAIDPICRDCLSDYSLVQYAASAQSPNPSSSGGYSTPEQATGAPDSPECGASTWAWMPELDDCSYTPCSIELTLKYPVVPRRLSLWFIWEADKVSHVDLVYSNGKIETITEVHAYCDTPWTMDLAASDVLEKITVYVSSPFVGVDALSIWSKPNVQQCKICRPLKYEIKRRPPFSSRSRKLSDAVQTSREIFTDEGLELGVTYEYSVTAVLGSKAGKTSQTLTYTHGNAFCGDGKVQSNLGESCDDGNRRDGDGCSLNCVIEGDFHCSGEPSLCYRHLGDGECEVFERQSSPEDCGYYTPPGYKDQWANTAVADPRFQLSVCPTSVLLGPSPLPLVCQSMVDSAIGWTPCGYLYDESLPWLKVFVKTPTVASSVIIYFHSDGRSTFDMSPKALDVSLIHGDDSLVPLVKEKEVWCQENPMSLSITHDLSKQFFLTKGVHLTLGSSKISISGVLVRSSKTNLPLVESCLQSGLLYNPKTGRCVDYQCQPPVCEKPVLKHGTLSCDSLTDGALCTATCDPGFELRMDKILTCVDGNWAGDVECSRVDCGQPLMAHAKFDCPDGTKFGSRCKFDCRSPAKKQGEGNTLTCEADGLWSAPQGYCLVMCPGPPSVKNTTLVTKSCGQSDQPVGTECKLRCHRGFQVEQAVPGRRTMKWACGSDGEWLGQACEKVRCPNPNPIFHGLYSCTDQNFVNSTCVLKCPGPNGATSRIKCQVSGEWNNDWEMCKFEPGDCPDPTSAEQIGFHCPSSSIGSECEVHCPPNKAPIQKKALTASADTSPESADFILCTGSKTWFPPVENIRCIEKCKSDFIGDGYCDEVNNKAMCSWDGGDCCPSTVLGGVVQPFPANCMDPCACKDPDAQENKRINRVRRIPNSLL